MATNEELIKQIRKEPTTKAYNMQLIFEQNQPLIKRCIKPYLAVMESEDLIQIAFISMYEAIEKYEESKALFMTIYPYYIRKYIIKELEKNSAAYIPAYMHADIYKLEKIKASYMETHTKEPSIKQLASAMQKTTEQIKEIEKASNKLQAKSIYEPVKTDKSEELTIQDTIPGADFEEEIIRKLYLEQLRHDIWEVVETCERKDAQAIKLYYRDNLTLEQVGEAMNISRDGARNHIKNGLKHLRHNETVQKLANHMEQAMQDAYKSNISNFKRTNTSSTERAAIKLYNLENKQKEIEGKILKDKRQTIDTLQLVLDTQSKHYTKDQIALIYGIGV